MPVYGETLSSIIQRYGRVVPPFLERCMSFVLAHADVVGIFRVPGEFQEIQRLTEIVNATGTLSIQPTASPHVIAGVISRFLRALPGHLFCDSAAAAWARISKPIGSLDPYGDADLRAVAAALAALPLENRIFAGRVFGFFVLIARNPVNQMSLYNLSVPLAPVLVTNAKSRSWLLDPRLVEFVLSNYDALFGDVCAIDARGEWIEAEAFEERVKEKMNATFFFQTVAIDGGADEGEREREAKIARRMFVPEPNWDTMFRKLLCTEACGEQYFSRALTPI